MPGPIAQWVTCLATDASLTADPGVTNHSRRVVVSYKPQYVHEDLVLVNCLFKLAQEKVWLGELTVPS